LLFQSGGGWGLVIAGWVGVGYLVSSFLLAICLSRFWVSAGFIWFVIAYLVSFGLFGCLFRLTLTGLCLVSQIVIGIGSVQLMLH